MSWVANLMVSAHRVDTPAIVMLDAWLRERAPRREIFTDGQGSQLDPQPLGVGWLSEITGADENHWGGGKNPEANVWAGALNHADLRSLLEQIPLLPWKLPHVVQIFLMDQEEDYFRVYMLRQGALLPYTLEPPPDEEINWPF